MTDLKSLTLGRRIQVLRRDQALTQENLAERMGVTAQAVSKWENDQSCPDIMALPQLAKELHTTVDTLLTGESAEAAANTLAKPAKKPEELIVRIAIDDKDTRVCCNLPFTVFRLSALYGMLGFTFSAEEGDIDAEQTAKAMAGVDFKHIVALIESGVTGMLVNVQGILTIWTE